MSNNSIPVNVSVMGKDYKISCPEGEHTSLLASAKHVDTSMKKIREGGKALGAERIAVMAAINIAHEMLSGKGGNVNNDKLSGQIDALQVSLDASLKSFQS
ncbi:MAG TPA: cell division protein ZapA [Leucothrix sp.]|nr:cell division protein ZapA [Leucothrix sp.]